MPEKFMQKKLTNFIEKHSSQKGLLLFGQGHCNELLKWPEKSRQLNILNLIIALLNPLAKKDWIRYVHLWLTPARTLTNLPSKADPNCVLTDFCGFDVKALLVAGCWLLGNFGRFDSMVVLCWLLGFMDLIAGDIGLRFG
nr:hypothetical protein CFP56_40417 [Quercus suber]